MIDNKIQNITPEEHQAFFEAYSNQISKQTKYIYIDLTYLQDIYLGAILNITQDKEVYPYILKQLKKYNLRVHDDYNFYFPELNLTNEEIMNYIADKNNSKLLMMTSPATDMFKYLSKLHQELLEQNRYKIGIHETIRKLTYIINTYPLILNEDDMKFFKKRFILSLNDPVINFGIISKPNNSLSIDTYRKFDILYISDLTSFSDENSNGFQALYKLGVFRDTTIYTEPKITNPEVIKDVPTMTQADFMNIQDITYLSLCMFCDIHMLKSKIWIEDKK